MLAEGHTYEGPVMLPGILGVLLRESVRGVLLNPQLSDAYTLKVPLMNPAPKFTVTAVLVVVRVLPPPLMVAPPVTLQV